MLLQWLNFSEAVKISFTDMAQLEAEELVARKAVLVEVYSDEDDNEAWVAVVINLVHLKCSMLQS